MRGTLKFPFLLGFFVNKVQFSINLMLKNIWKWKKKYRLKKDPNEEKKHNSSE
jgi:hypothetical protein